MAPFYLSWVKALVCGETTRPWQIARDRLIDDPFQEDGTDFLSYAAGASPRIPDHDCRGVVVAGHAGQLVARADRSGGQAAVRLLRAIPRGADAAGPDHACLRR